MNVRAFLRVIEILQQSAKNWDVPVIHLISNRDNDPFRILVSTLLSSRTQDKVTIEATKRLFKRADSPEKVVRLPEEKIQELIYPVGFYRVKAKNLKRLAQIIVEDYRGKIPSERERLMSLPGVGRKTANLVRSVAFGIPDICVDTHVHRITNRMGIVLSKNPQQTEQQLKMKLPPKVWNSLNWVLVALGQAICKPSKPLCNVCPVEMYCEKRGVH